MVVVRTGFFFHAAHKKVQFMWNYICLLNVTLVCFHSLLNLSELDLVFHKKTRRHEIVMRLHILAKWSNLNIASTTTTNYYAMISEISRPCSPIDSIIILMSVWRITGKIIRTTIMLITYARV